MCALGSATCRLRVQLWCLVGTFMRPRVGGDVGGWGWGWGKEDIVDMVV